MVSQGRSGILLYEPVEGNGSRGSHWEGKIFTITGVALFSEGKYPGFAMDDESYEYNLCRMRSRAMETSAFCSTMSPSSFLNLYASGLRLGVPFRPLRWKRSILFMVVVRSNIWYSPRLLLMGIPCMSEYISSIDNRLASIILPPCHDILNLLSRGSSFIGIFSIYP